MTTDRKATAAADTWWDSLSPSRKMRLHQWLARDAAVPEVVGQQPLPLDGMSTRPRRRDRRGRFTT